MSIAIITGSSGLIGSEAAAHFASMGMDVVGIDNDMCSVFFGPEATTEWSSNEPDPGIRHYRRINADIRDRSSIDAIFREYGNEIELVIHTAAQPSHEWAARDPYTDFGVNAVGTLTLLEATRQHCPEAVFIFTSTSKVYGDAPNRLPLAEQKTRWEIDPRHPYAGGIPEELSIDHCMRSVFGASKLSADVMVQEYGRSFGMNTVCFRGGCMTGPARSGTQLHGFLAYLMKCCATETPYTVFGYGGKQVSDNIHSHDLIQAFDAFYRNPRQGEVYNIGGGRFSNCSILEAIALCEKITSLPLRWTYENTSRIGDQIWWIGDISRFQSHYPQWALAYDIEAILQESYSCNADHWQHSKVGVAA